MRNSLKTTITKPSNRLNTIDFWIIAGQSNAKGNTGGVQPNPPYISPNPNAYMVGDSGGNLIVPTFEPLVYNTTPSLNNSLGGEHGSELRLAYRYGNQQVYFVKVTLGGTNLEVDWASGSTLRNTLISNINYAKTFAQNNNIIPVWKIYWNQWENDAVTAGYADLYQTNYENFINDVLNTTGIELSAHYIFQCNTESVFYYNNVVDGNKIITAKINNASTFNAKLVYGEGLPFHDDDKHYTSESYHKIADRIWEA